MLSLRRIFGLMLLFFFFEAVVAVVTTLAFPEVNVFLACVAMTGLAVAVWAAFVLITRVMMRPRTPQPPSLPRPAAPVSPRPMSGTDSFTQELNVLIAEANRRLAGSLPSNPRGETPVLANLPLYLVIGGEGSGKSTTILNSGLEPRLLAGEAERDGAVMPTRICNLWFGEGAVFADMAGRVLTQEPENWERALRVFSQPYRIPRWKQLLLGRRVQSNLKGVVLVCDTNMFARASDPQRTTPFARTLNERLQTIGTVLRRDVPVYLLFSKSDGIAYFREFFAHLSESESRRLLGVTLPVAAPRNDTADIYADREGKRLTNYLSRLHMSLAEKRLVLLAREDQSASKSKVYEFPRELKKLRGDLVQFLLDVFRPNPLQHSPRLRGFYFSGQRWIARNLSPEVEATAASFTVMPKRADATVFLGGKAEMRTVASPRAASGPAGTIPKWMFLSDLFHNVVLKDRAGDIKTVENTPDREYRHMALAGMGALLLILSFLWANSWRNNRRLLNELEQTVAKIHFLGEQDTLAAASFSDIESLRAALAPLLNYERHGAPLSYRWGLYSGHDVTTSLTSLYFDRFRRMFLEPMLQSLTASFSRLEAGTASDEDVYDRLKAYRMIASGECKPEGEFLGAQLMPIWSSAVSLSSDASVLADPQMRFYVSELITKNPYQQQIREDSPAVSQAQTYLRELNGPDKIFRALVGQTDHDQQPDMLSRYVPNYTEVISGPNQMEAAYTREGWDLMTGKIQNHKLTSAGEACVIGTQSAGKEVLLSAQTERQVKDLYVTNYIEQWKAFLGAHHVQPFRNQSDAAQRLHILADNNRSPLLGLIYMASRDTNLPDSTSGFSGVSQAIEQTKTSVTNKIKDIFGPKNGSPPNPTSPDTSSGGQLIVNEFAPVHAVVDPANSEKWLNPSNQAYMLALEELSNSIAALPPEIDPKDQAQQQAHDRATKAVEAARAANHALGAAVPNTSSRVDVTIASLLDEPIAYAERFISSIPQKYENDPWLVNRSARSLCTSMDGLRSKYPFNSTAAQEASLQDLNQAFAPVNGAFGIFAHLPAVSRVYLRQGAGWAPNPSFPGQFSQPFLQSLNNLGDFSDALFADPNGSPHLDYTLTLDATGKVPVQLDVDGHTLIFNPKRGPVSAQLVWPPVTNNPTRLVVKASLPLPVQISGLWSIFRLLQGADQQQGNLFIFNTVQFANGSKVPLRDNKGNSVTIQIRIASSAHNTFSKGYFGKLRCENFEGWAVNKQ